MKDFLGEDEKTRKLFKSYLGAVGLKSIPARLNKSQVMSFLGLIIDDYRKAKLETADLSILCEKLALLCREDPELKKTAIHWHLTEAGDIGWYLVRHADTAQKMVKDLINFYENYSA